MIVSLESAYYTVGKRETQKREAVLQWFWADHRRHGVIKESVRVRLLKGSTRTYYVTYNARRSW